jgi:hypothetical protein
VEIPELDDVRIAAFYGGAAIVLVLVPFLGGKPERYCIAIMFGSLVAQTILHSVFGAVQFDEVDWIVLVADALILFGMAWIAVSADRIWPIFAASLALISLVSHLARQFTDMLGFSYAQYNVVPTGLILLLVFLGTVCHRIRLRIFREDPDWVAFDEYSEFRRIAGKSEL